MWGSGLLGEEARRSRASTARSGSETDRHGGERQGFRPRFHLVGAWSPRPHCLLLDLGLSAGLGPVSLHLTGRPCSDLRREGP